MAKAKAHRGGCLCGAVRFEAKGRPGHVGNCHCTMCQKATGAAFGSFAGFKTAGVRFTTGKVKEYRSSKWAARGFCATCGGSLTYRLVKDASQIWLALGAMDDTRRLRPAANIFVGTMMAWVRRTKDGLPRHKGFS